MALSDSLDVTRLLVAAGDDPAALDALLSRLYTELHALAHRQRRRTGAPATLNTTALLHEAYEKLIQANGAYTNRAHFFRVAAQAMRHILVDYARRYLTAKRGGGVRPGTLDEGVFAVARRSEEILALDEALERLAHLSERQAEVVKLRYFAGFTLPEVADILDLSESTVWRDWVAARAWLQQTLAGDDDLPT